MANAHSLWGKIRPVVEAVTDLERRTLSAEDIEGIVLRYGHFYGPHTFYASGGSIADSIREGQMPVIGNGAGTYSFVHVEDAATATLHALTHGTPGIYNIADDAPAPLSEWLPIYTELLSSPTPPRMSETTALEAVGPFLVYMAVEQRGASNTKAKRELGWRPSKATWHAGFKALLTSPA